MKKILLSLSVLFFTFLIFSTKSNGYGYWIPVPGAYTENQAGFYCGAQDGTCYWVRVGTVANNPYNGSNINYVSIQGNVYGSSEIQISDYNYIDNLDGTSSITFTAGTWPTGTWSGSIPWSEFTPQ